MRFYVKSQSQNKAGRIVLLKSPSESGMTTDCEAVMVGCLFLVSSLAIAHTIAQSLKFCCVSLYFCAVTPHLRNQKSNKHTIIEVF